MARFALVQDGRIVNLIAAEPGWKHPDGELVPDHELTEEWAEKQGIRFARDGEDIKAAYAARATIVLSGVGEAGIYQLLNNELPEGCFIRSSSGTTGDRKLACTPWAKIERRAQAFLDMAGPDFKGPVWFPGAFWGGGFRTTGKMACVLNDIPCFFGRRSPEIEPSVVAGTPKMLISIFPEIPPRATVISTGDLITEEMVRAFLRSGRSFVDLYSSADGGAVFVNRYRMGDDGAPVFETVFPEGERPVVGVDGLLEVPLDQASDRYLTNDLPVRDGRFVTGDRAVELGGGRIKVVGRG